MYHHDIIATTQIISAGPDLLALQHLNNNLYSDFSFLSEARRFQPCIHLVESHSCWCYNSQEIATLIAHLLLKDFPRMNYFLLADTGEQTKIIKIISLLLLSFSSRWPWLVSSSVLTRAGRPDRDRRQRTSPYKALSSSEPSGWATAWGSYRGSGRSCSVGQLRPVRLSGRNGNWAETPGGRPDCQPRWVPDRVLSSVPWFWSSRSSSGRWGKTEELSKEFRSLKTWNLNPLGFSK